MNTLSVTVRYRPIRIGWCVRRGDIAAFREALKLSFTMWGGRYNPVIPVDDPEYASSLVRVFHVDVLWPVSKDELVKKFIKSFPHLPNPFFHDALFLEGENGRKRPQILDIYHPIRKFYEEHIKNNPNPQTKVKIYKWQPDDVLADVLLVTFGDLPSVEQTGTDYLELLRRDLLAEIENVDREKQIPPRTKKEFPISSFCRLYLQRHYSIINYWGGPGLYIGDATDFDDLVNFWNLRATDAMLMFYDFRQALRLDQDKETWLEIVRSRPKRRFELDNAVTIWFKDGSEPDLGTFGKDIKLCTARPSVWNGLNVKAPYIFYSEGSSLGTLEDSSTNEQRLSFQLPQKPFSEKNIYGQHLIISVDPGIGLYSNEHSTLHPLYVPELNEYYGRKYYFDWNKARVEIGSIGIISNAYTNSLTLSAMHVTELIKQLFKVVGINAELSKPGLIATRLIQQMGGLQGCRPFKVAGVRRLIESTRPEKSFTRSFAIQTIRDKNEESGNVTFSLYEGLHIEPSPFDSKLTPDAVFSYLLKKMVFQAGLRFDCPNCRLEFWTSIDNMKTEIKCEYCNHQFNVTPYLKDRDWAFRRSGLFGRGDNQEGAIPVILTLMQLHTRFNMPSLIYTTAMNLKPESAKISACETDFVAVIPGREGRLNVAIGECKNRKEITADDVAKLKAVANAFPSELFDVFVIFSKLDSFSHTEIDSLKQLNEEYHRRAILFTPRELEPYFLYERTSKEFSINEYAGSYEAMVGVTETVFFSKKDKES